MQNKSHYINGCSKGMLLNANKKPWGVTKEEFYKTDAAQCCQACSKILANEWKEVPETSLSDLQVK